MKPEFDVLCKYLRGADGCDDYLRERYETRFGRHNLNYINSLLIVVYLKDISSIIGINNDLNVKLLFLVALLEASPAHKTIFPEKQPTLLRLVISPLLMLAFFISLFLK